MIGEIQLDKFRKRLINRIKPKKTNKIEIRNKANKIISRNHLGGHENITHIDEAVLDYLIRRFRPHSFLDVGCGPGGMVSIAKSRGLYSKGIDGDDNIKFEDLILHDFQNGKIDIKRKFDIIWSTEFLEHIPEELLGNVFYTLKNCSKEGTILIITAAPPKSKGHYHVNLQNSDYWIEVFESNGFQYSKSLTTSIRRLSSMRREFMRKTGLVFQFRSKSENKKSEHQKTKKICFYSYYGGGKRHAELLRKYYECRNSEFSIIKPCSKWCEDVFSVVTDIISSDIIFIWNGQDPGCDWIKSVCKAHNIKYLYAELGLLPQKNNWHIDPNGIIGKSSLCKELSWVDDEMIRKYEQYKETYIRKNKLYYNPGEYILIPLQLEFDSAFYLYSGYARISDFIADMESKYDKIIISPHPVRKDIRLYPKKAKIIRDTPTIKLALKSKQVIGLTSTILYETSMLGIPTEAIGDCPMKYHKDDQIRLLAAVYHRQIPEETTDLTRWINDLL